MVGVLLLRRVLFCAVRLRDARRPRFAAARRRDRHRRASACSGWRSSSPALFAGARRRAVRVLQGQHLARDARRRQVGRRPRDGAARRHADAGRARSVGAVTFTWLQDTRRAQHRLLARDARRRSSCCWCCCSRRASPASSSSVCDWRRAQSRPAHATPRARHEPAARSATSASRSAACKAVDGIGFELARRRTAGADRPQRRRQVDHLQHGQRPAQRRRRLDPARRRTNWSACKPRDDLAPRRRPHIPDRRDLRLADGGRERADGAAVADGQLFSMWRRAADAQARRGAARCSSRSAWRRRPTGRAACSPTATSSASSWRSRMANAPKLLLMDEPTAGMAPKERNELMALTKRLVVERGIGGAVHRAQHGRGVRLCRPHDRAGARPADRRGRRRPRSATIRRCRRCTSAAARPSRRSAVEGAPRDRAAPSRDERRCIDASRCSRSRPGRLVRRRADPVRRRPRGRRGEVVALMGRNGAGKSTTLKALMGMLAKRRGTRALPRPRHLARRSRTRSRALGLGFVPEDRRIFTDLTVMENLDVGRQPSAAGPTAAPRRTGRPSELFKLFPNLGEMPDRPGGRMSGGEQQMLTVARTLMGNPYLVLLDEPSEGVAPVIVEQMAQHDPRAQGARASASCCPSRTCTSPNWCPTAPTCSKRARSATAGRWTSWPPTKRCGART